MGTPEPMATDMVLVNVSGSPNQPKSYESGTKWKFDRGEKNIIRERSLEAREGRLYYELM